MYVSLYWNLALYFIDIVWDSLFKDNFTMEYCYHGCLFLNDYLKKFTFLNNDSWNTKLYLEIISTPFFLTKVVTVTFLFVYSFALRWKFLKTKSSTLDQHNTILYINISKLDNSISFLRIINSYIFINRC